MKEEPLLLGTSVGTNEKETVKKFWLGIAWWVFLGIAIAVCFTVARSSLFWLPSPRDADLCPKTQFSGERAWKLLGTLVSRFGVRHSSTPAAVESMQFIIEKIESAKANSSSKVSLEWTLTRHSTVAAFEEGIVFCSEKPLLAIRLSDGTNETKRRSVIVDAHADSAMMSPGACDDGTGIAAIVEMIENVLSLGSYPWKHAVIFVIGTEEEALEGARAFIGQHPWRESASAFVNLECGGDGLGIPYLYQFSDEWAVSKFSAAPRPASLSLLNDVFGKGIEGGRSHYWVYKREGLSGLDIAFLTGGLTYHTPRDDISRISPGGLQHEGDNLRAIVEGMANDDQLDSHRKLTPSGLAFGLGASFRLNIVSQWLLFAVSVIVLAGILGFDHSRLVFQLKLMAASSGFAFLSTASSIALALGTAGLACSARQLAFISNIDIFLSCSVVAIVLGCHIPLFFWPRAMLSIVGPARPSVDLGVLQWAICHGVATIHAFIFVVFRATGLDISIFPLLALLFTTVSAVFGFASMHFKNRIRLWVWAIGAWVIPVVCSLLPLFLWGAPVFITAGFVLFPALSWDGYGPVPGMFGSSTLAILGTIFLLAPAAIFHLGFQGAELQGHVKSWIRLFGKNLRHTKAIASVSTLLLIALVVSVMARPPFTEKFRSRLYITHHAWHGANATNPEISMTLMFHHGTEDLQRDLHGAGIEARQCEIQDGDWALGSVDGLCISAKTMPEVGPASCSVSSIDIGGGWKNVTAAISPSNGTSRVHVIFPCKPGIVELDGTAMPSVRMRLTISFGDVVSPHSVSFSCHNCTGDVVRIHVDSVTPSAELRTVIASLPNWVAPSSGSSSNAPQSLWSNFVIP